MLRHQNCSRGAKSSAGNWTFVDGNGAMSSILKGLYGRALAKFSALLKAPRMNHVSVSCIFKKTFPIVFIPQLSAPFSSLRLFRSNFHFGTLWKLYPICGQLEKRVPSKKCSVPCEVAGLYHRGLPHYPRAGILCIKAWAHFYGGTSDSEIDFTLTVSYCKFVYVAWSGFSAAKPCNTDTKCITLRVISCFFSQFSVHWWRLSCYHYVQEHRTDGNERTCCVMLIFMVSVCAARG